MSSHKQITANRRNALKSTGPRTEEGKSIVCLNATKHGILCQELPVDKQEGIFFDEFCLRLYTQWNPIGDLEHFLVDRIISCAWRLRRVIQVETDFFRRESNPKFNFSEERSIKNIFTGYAKDGMAVLSRYEMAIEKSLYKAIAEITRLQAIRGQAHLHIIDSGADEIGFVSQKRDEKDSNAMNPLI